MSTHKHLYKIIIFSLFFCSILADRQQDNVYQRKMELLTPNALHTIEHKQRIEPVPYPIHAPPIHEHPKYPHTTPASKVAAPVFVVSPVNMTELNTKGTTVYVEDLQPEKTLPLLHDQMNASRNIPTYHETLLLKK